MKPDKHKKGGPSKDHASQQTKSVGRDAIEKDVPKPTEEEQGSSKSYSRRKIESNWERYEEPTSSITYQEAYEPEGDDFNKLLQMPSTADSHFVLKSEQLEPPPCSSLFALNLKSLASGLATIPFYEQVDIPIETFSVAELDKQEEVAKNSQLLS